ncbi:MAG: glutamate--tRNA ligase family protein [Opitutales bacterium]
MKFVIGNDRLLLPRRGYRGRIAPTPTGFLHLGHARTFSIAHQRARATGGEILYRCEDLDGQRCKKEYADAALEDLRWLGLDWDCGPDDERDSDIWIQSKRHEVGCYLDAWRYLRDKGLIYPCDRSRRELNLLENTRCAPTELGGELIFPEELRKNGDFRGVDEPGAKNWRFRVDYVDEEQKIVDGRLGPGTFTPGRDYGDFLVWRRDGFPSYELAVVVDDILMGITEVVRGADLWISTARQLELYRAFESECPDFYHCDLVKDSSGERLAKRKDSLAIRELRLAGHTASDVIRLADSQV